MLAVPDRNAVAEPDLSRDAPVTDILHPIGVYPGKSFGDKLDLPVDDFLDGRFSQDLSDPDAPVRSLARHLPELEGRLGALARVEDLPLVALNTALFEDGVLIDLAPGEDGGVIELLSVTRADRPVASHPRHLIPARSRLPRPEQVALFIRNVEKEFGTVERVPSAEAVPAAIADYLVAQNLPSERIFVGAPRTGTPPEGWTPRSELSLATQ